MRTRIVVNMIDGSKINYDDVDHYSEYDGFLSITCKTFITNKTFTTITKINLRNVIGYSAVVSEENKEDTNNG